MKLSTENKDGIRQALFKISYGLFIVSSLKDGKVNAQVCNTVFQLTSTPARIAVCLNKDNLTNEYIKGSGVLAVSVLGQNDYHLIKGFGYRSGRDFDKFKGVPYNTAETGAPVLENCIAFMDCRVNPDMTVDVGTHTLFVADVLGGGVIRDDEPMTYDFYRKNRSVMEKALSGGVKGKKRWMCKVCGYIHEGEEPPEECPVCGAGKDAFELVD